MFAKSILFKTISAAQKSFQKKVLYKECPPAQTLRIAQQSLHALGLRIKLKYEKNKFGIIHACGVQVAHTPIKTEGKGVSKKYARCSALGELFERLQNGLHFRNVEFRQEARQKFGFVHDPNEMRFGAEDIPELPAAFIAEQFIDGDISIAHLWSQYKKYAIETGQKVTCVPFYTPKTNSTVYIPHDFYQLIYGSNGMAAGNSREEALSQAICEILERYALRRIMFEDIPLPTIPHEFIKENAPCQYSVIERIESSAKCRIVVKDASLGLNIPIVAVIIIFQENQTYAVRFGASTIWPIALERCLTEFYQGILAARKYHRQAAPFEPALPMSQEERLKNFKLHLVFSQGGGKYPLSFFKTTEEHRATLPQWLNGPASFKQNVKEMSTTIQDLGFNIYVRDVTCTPFNAYHVIIPGMSGVKYLSAGIWQPECNMIPRAQMIRTLDTLPQAALEQLTTSIEHHIAWWQDPETGPAMNIAGFTSFPVQAADPWARFDVRPLLAFLYYRLDRDASAADTIYRYISQAEKHRLFVPPNLYIFRDILGCCVHDGMSLENAMRNTCQWYNPLVVQKVAGAMQERTTIFSSSLLPGGIVRTAASLYADAEYKNMEQLYLTLKSAKYKNPANQLSLNTAFQ